MEKGKYLYTLMPRDWKAPIYRASYRRRYGSRCFLKPLSYPICTKGKIDCKGVQAAAYYVRLNKDKSVTRKLDRLKHYCKRLKRTRRVR